jgi:hypothetical protein
VQSAGDDDFKRGGISGVSSGQKMRLICGQFSWDGTTLSLEAQSGLFRYGPDGRKMAFEIMDDGRALKNDKQLVLHRK